MLQGLKQLGKAESHECWLFTAVRRFLVAGDRVQWVTSGENVVEEQEVGVGGQGIPFIGLSPPSQTYHPRGSFVPSGDIVPRCVSGLYPSAEGSAYLITNSWCGSPAACAVDESLGLAFRFIYADGQVICLREVVTVHEVFVRVRDKCGGFVRCF